MSKRFFKVCKNIANRGQQDAKKFANKFEQDFKKDFHMDCSRFEKYIKTFRTACSTLLTSHRAQKYGNKQKRCKNNLHKTSKRLQNVSQKLYKSFHKAIQTIAISRTPIKYDLHCFQMDDHTFLSLRHKRPLQIWEVCSL